ncbi:hypothetical protein ACHAXT_012895 [Thalassiosira profunda]
MEGWNCAACTFRHRHRHPRCQMCGALRGASGQEVRDFVTGANGAGDGGAVADNGRKANDVGGGADRGGGGPPSNNFGGECSTSGGNAANRPQHHSAAAPAASTMGGARPTSAGGPSKPVPNPYARRPSPPKNPYARPPSRPGGAGASGGPPPPGSNDNFVGRAQNGAGAGGAMPAGASGQGGRPMRQKANQPPGTPGQSAAVPTARPSAVRNPYARPSPARNAGQQQQPPKQSWNEVEHRAGQPNRPGSSYATSTGYIERHNLHRFFGGANPLTSPDKRRQQQQRPSQSPDRQWLQQRQQPQPPRAFGLSAANASPGRSNHPSSKKQGHLTAMGITRQYHEGPVPLDSNAAETWIFPKHPQYPERNYQFEMAHAAIMQNTLVSLPTGLGKTLIAAVVMYNYYRMFPTGMVVFVAPTRPLVTQQIEAVQKVVGIAESQTAEITGKTRPDARTQHWNERRLFFCTPQTLVKDITDGRCDAEKIVCVVMDEAHRATGEHANAVLVRLIANSGGKFRMVGLSATPGTDIKSIQAIVDTLRITKIEARMEDDPNVRQYINHREEEVIVVKQGDAIKRIDGQFSELMGPILEKLRDHNVSTRLQYDTANLSGWLVMKAQEDYGYGRGLDLQFAVLRVLADARQKLKGHGVPMARSVLLDGARRNNFMNHIERTPGYQALLRQMAAACGEEAEGVPDAAESNPKLATLARVLATHFERKKAVGESTRAIVFSQWRESVGEIVATLQSRGTSSHFKPAQFIGQASKKKDKNGSTGAGGSGMNQKQQHAVLGQFNRGVFNVLVCTCVGEEGLDIAEVDLIVNFDVMKSPIRSIQRSGRTGRKRNGRVVFLVAEGAEERSYRQSKEKTKTIARALRDPGRFKFSPDNPMFPAEPNVERKVLEIKDFRLSQVGGHTPKTKRSGGGTRKGTRRVVQSKSVIDTNWRLDSAQEEERVALFGELPRSSCHDYEHTGNAFPPSLKRKYLNARSQSLSLKGKEGASNRRGGTSSNLVRMLETIYISAGKGSAPEGRTLKDKDSTKIGQIMEDPMKSLESDDDCQSVDFGSDVMVVDDDDGDCVAPKRSPPRQTLDDIFGPVAQDAPGTFDLSRIANLFDEEHYEACAIVAPPGMALDDTDDSSESESCESAASKASSDLSANDDLCAFFDNNNANDFGVVDSHRKSNDKDDESVLKTPLSDHGADVDIGGDDTFDFGGNDTVDFGTPCDIDEDPRADAGSPGAVADAGKCLESTLVIDEGNKTDRASSKDHAGQIDAGNEKENIDLQLSLSPGRGSDQSKVGECLPRKRDETAEKEVLSSTKDAPRNNDRDQYDAAQLNADVMESEMNIDTNKEGPEGDQEHVEAQSPVVATFRLPTPPPSSSEESDDESDTSDNASQNASMCDKDPPPVQNDTSETHQFDSFDVAVQEDAAPDERDDGKEVSFFQLPTQDSSSSEEEEEEEEEEEPEGSGRPTDNENTLETTAVADAARENESGNQSMSLECSTDNPHTERHVQFTADSFLNKSVGGDLTDTPVKARAEKSGGLADKPFHCRQSPVQNRQSLESLTDTPMPSRRNPTQRKSFDGLVDTPHQSSQKVAKRRKRLRAAAKEESEEKAESGTAEKMQKKDRLRKKMEDKYACRFLDCEAANDDSDESDDEDEARRLEDEEMSHDSFINDTSQLGYSQDELDRLNADAEVEVCDDGDVLHRQLDHQQNVDAQFKTPVFNRRMRAPSSPHSAPGSQKGLGKMEFIKSVLEHHRHGGDADELEAEYHRLARKEDQSMEVNDSFDLDCSIQSEQPQSERSTNERSQGPPSVGAGPNHASPGGAIRDGLGSQPNLGGGAPAMQPAAAPSQQPGGLTAEQRALIEAKRAEALRRRQQRMQQQASVAAANPYAGNPYAK